LALPSYRSGTLSVSYVFCSTARLDAGDMSPTPLFLRFFLLSTYFAVIVFP
jgi:hypothetical protein